MFISIAHIIRLFILLCVSLYVLGCHSKNDTAIFIDQEFVPKPHDIFSQFNEQRVAQTFTVGASGVLSKVEVLISQLNPRGNLIAEIQKNVVRGTVVDGHTTLAVATIPLTRVPSSSPGGTGPSFVTIDFSSSKLRVMRGDRLALVLHRDRWGLDQAYGVAWLGNRPESGVGYDGGEALIFFPAGLVYDFLTEKSFFLPDRWEMNPQLTDYGFRTYILLQK